MLTNYHINSINRLKNIDKAAKPPPCLFYHETILQGASPAKKGIDTHGKQCLFF